MVRACGMRGSAGECGWAGGLQRGARLESRPDYAPARLAQVLPRGSGRRRASSPSDVVCSTFVHVISKEDILLRILGQLPHALLSVVAVTCSQFSRVIVPCEDADAESWKPRCPDASMLPVPCRYWACSCCRSLCTPSASNPELAAVGALYDASCLRVHSFQAGRGRAARMCGSGRGGS